MVRFLYHGTGEADVGAILAEGLDDPSYWGDLPTASAYAGDCGRILRIPVERFDPASLAYNDLVARQCIENGDDMPAEGTWQESIDLMGSVRYDARMRVTEDDLVDLALAEDEERALSPRP